MPVYRYRSIAEMPPPWRDPADAGNLRVVAEMMVFYRRCIADSPAPGVRRYRSVEEASADRGDPYRVAASE